MCVFVQVQDICSESLVNFAKFLACILIFYKASGVSFSSDSGVTECCALVIMKFSLMLTVSLL